MYVYFIVYQYLVMDFRSLLGRKAGPLPKKPRKSTLRWAYLGPFDVHIPYLAARYDPA